MADKVLIVEDNELNRNMLCSLLNANGYETIMASNGIEALDMTRIYRPDIILMDIQLPELPGTEVTKLIKSDASLRHIPILAVTAFGLKEDEKEIRESGVDEYILKPISIVPFLSVIRKHLDKRIKH